MSKPIEYEIVQLDGTTKTMTAASIAEATGYSVQLIRRRLNEQGMRSMDRLSVSPQEALRRGRQKFLNQTSAHFAAEKKRRAAEAAHPRKPWRDWKER